MWAHSSQEGCLLLIPVTLTALTVEMINLSFWKISRRSWIPHNNGWAAVEEKSFGRKIYCDWRLMNQRSEVYVLSTFQFFIRLVFDVFRLLSSWKSRQWQRCCGWKAQPSAIWLMNGGNELRKWFFTNEFIFQIITFTPGVPNRKRRLF